MVSTDYLLWSGMLALLLLSGATTTISIGLIILYTVSIVPLGLELTVPLLTVSGFILAVVFRWFTTSVDE
jgi:hypothetical protein